MTGGSSERPFVKLATTITVQRADATRVGICRHYGADPLTHPRRREEFPIYAAASYSPTLPEEWARRWWFWADQHLVEALLTDNARLELLSAVDLLVNDYLAAFAAACPAPSQLAPGPTTRVVLTGNEDSPRPAARSLSSPRARAKG